MTTYATYLLLFFVSNTRKLYGSAFITYNTHNLIHIHDDVKYFDTALDGFSCFPCENHLQILKKF